MMCQQFNYNFNNNSNYLINNNNKKIHRIINFMQFHKNTVKREDLLDIIKS